MQTSPPCAPPAMYYDPGDFDTSGGIMGRQVAGESFLAALFRHGRSDHFHVHATSEPHARSFAQKARRAKAGAQVKWVMPTGFAGLAEAGGLFFPSPALAQFAWRRAPLGAEAFSLFGIAHAIATPQMIQQIAALATAPLAPWDAIVCPSNSIRRAILAIVEPMRDHVQGRCGGTGLALPHLPIIPLGVEPEDFAPDAVHRAQWRQRLGIGDEDIALLSIGRFSFHAKAHPCPLYAAMERAAQACGRRLHLIEAGWYAQEDMADFYARARAQWMPSVTSHVLNGRDEAVRREIRSAADMFISLVDNLQESFGLTPVEAMAAGLPAIVSDWNGYRETIRHGVDGLLIPTAMAPAGLGPDIAERVAAGMDDGEHYLARTSQTVAVDIAGAAEAIIALADNPDLRRQMAQAGRARVAADFAWGQIIPQYEALWADSAEQRRAAGLQPRSDNLTMPDPFALFAGYASTTLAPNSLIVPDAVSPAISELMASPFTLIGGELVLGGEDMEQLMALCQRLGQTTLAEILAHISEAQRPLAARSLLWLAKWGRVRILAGN